MNGTAGNLVKDIGVSAVALFNKVVQVPVNIAGGLVGKSQGAVVCNGKGNVSVFDCAAFLRDQQCVLGRVLVGGGL